MKAEGKAAVRRLKSRGWKKLDVDTKIYRMFTTIGLPVQRVHEAHSMVLCMVPAWVHELLTEHPQVTVLGRVRPGSEAWNLAVSLLAEASENPESRKAISMEGLMEKESQ